MSHQSDFALAFEKKNSRRDDIFNVLTLYLKKKHLSWQNDDDFSIRSDGSSMVTL
jgi:hypothetical protein